MSNLAHKSLTMRGSYIQYGRLIRKNERQNGVSIPPPAKYKFDEASGLQYTETTSAIAGQDDRDWFHKADLTSSSELKDSNLKTDSHRQLGRGTRSFQDTLYEFIAQNISRFSLDGIAFLPVRLVEKLWDIIRKRQGISFHVFAIFSAILGKEAARVDLLKHRTQIIIQRSSLDVYTIPLTSKSFDFLTILSITSPINLVDLVKLSNVTNLIALEVVSSVRQPNTGVSDRLVRAWSFAARDEGAFPVLRILKLWNHEDITSQSLSYIDGFPILAVYDIRGCNVKMHSKLDLQHAKWSACMNKSVLSLLEGVCIERTKHAQSKLGSESNLAPRLASRSLSKNAKVKWIPREDVPKYMAHSETAGGALPADIPSISEYPHPRKKQGRKDSQTEAWDSTIYSSLIRIGELRNDCDLSTRISIGEQAFVGNDLVISHPIASFRLGPTLPCLKPVDPGIQSYDLAFIRTSLPRPRPFGFAVLETGSPLPDNQSNVEVGQIYRFAPTQVPTASTTIIAPSDHSRGNITQTPAAGLDPKPHTKIAKRSVSVVPKNKRRKLDDVLKSFF